MGKSRLTDKLMETLVHVCDKSDNKYGYICFDFEYDREYSRFSEEKESRSFIIENILNGEERQELADRICVALKQSLNENTVDGIIDMLKNVKKARRKTLNAINEYFTEELHYHMFL